MKFLYAEGRSAVDIQHCLWTVYGGNVMLARTVCECVRYFHDEKRTNIHDEVREGRPHDQTNEV